MAESEGVRAAREASEEVSGLPGGDRFRALIGQMPAVMWVVDRDLRFTLSEGGALVGLGSEPGENVGRTLFEFFGTDDPGFTPIDAHLRALRGEAASYELDWMDRTFLTRVLPQTRPDGEIVGALGFAIDITERRMVERELRQAERKYRTLVEQIPCIVYVAGFGPTGQWLYVSPRIRDVLGYSPEEWMTQDNALTTHLHADDRERVLAEEAASQREGRPFRCEYRVLARNGGIVWIRDEAVPVASTPELWQGVMVDITAHKEIEQVLRMTVAALRETDEDRKRLLARVVDAREQEHRRIAGEVHDGPVQKTVAMRLRLEMLRTHLDDPELVDAVEELRRIAESVTRELRTLLFELVPPSLERGGLADAVRGLLDDLAAETGVDAGLEDKLETEPGEPARTTCFRILQEALKNVGKHAEARSVRVTLERSREGFLVRVADDGKGFAVGDSIHPGHLGLESVRERAESCGGWLKVTSRPALGTHVEFWLPDTGSGSEDR
jgi:two-component system sensor histidine kinase UhpB